jgi:hypothetical protein
MSNLIYNGQQINKRDSDGYVNGTDMCKFNGVLISDWLRLSKTESYIASLASDMGIPISDLMDIRKGGDSGQQGTWLHPLLALNLGRWISDPFAIWCDRHIKVLMETGSTSLSDQTINLKALARQEDQIKALEHQQEQLNGTVEMMQSEIKSKLYGYDYNIQREIHILGEQIINRFYPNVGWKDKKQAIKETYITHEIFYNYVNSVEERFCKIEWNVFNLSSSVKRNVEILTKRMKRIMDKFESQFKLDTPDTTISQEIERLKKNASVADHHFVQFLEQQAPNTSVDDAYIAYFLRPNT